MPMRDGHASPTSQSTSPARTDSNHVSVASSVVRSADSGTLNRDDTDVFSNQVNLMSLDTPESGRRGQNGGTSPGGSQQPSPSMSPVPPTSTLGVVGAAAGVVGVASATRGGSGSNSPIPPTSSQTSNRSRVASNGRPRQSGTSTPPQRPPAQTATAVGNRPQQPTIMVRPQQQQQASAGEGHGAFRTVAIF